jgi:hypothetical protein
MFIPDRFSPLMTFCLLALSVQYQPLEREAPQGGLETLPVKRIREANHQSDFGYPMYVLPIDSAESFW